MRIQSLRTHSFRNLVDSEIGPFAPFNVFLGRNAQGKTSLLEAIAVLASLRSFRASRLRDLIAFSLDVAQVEGGVVSRDVPIGLRVRLDRKGRQAWMGNHMARSAGDYLGRLSVVSFGPDDLEMIKGMPALRRRFIDRAAFLLEPHHLQKVKRFQKSLHLRNQLLREGTRGDPALLDGFTASLALEGAALTESRLRTFENLAGHTTAVFHELLGDPTQPEIRFLAGWDIHAGVSAANLQRQLLEGLTQDIRRGLTTRGPQADDFEFLLAGRSLKSFGSQGQQRAAAVSLVLSLLTETEKRHQDTPVVLLDDVSSELDPIRRERLLHRIILMGAQVFLTTTDPNLVTELRKQMDFFPRTNEEIMKVFEVREGQCKILPATPT